MAFAASIQQMPSRDVLLSVEDVAQRLNVTKDWVWDHSSRKAPYLPVIRMSDGVLRYRSSEVEEFINERERISSMRRKHR
jgi:predicted DNA-binding transcriptional regulator AlpA